MTRQRLLLTFGLLLVTSFGIGLAFNLDDTLTACRIANIPLGMLAALGFYVRVNDTWESFPLGWRILCAGILTLFIVAAAGSAEAYLSDAALGYRAVVLNLALVTSLTGLVIWRDD